MNDNARPIYKIAGDINKHWKKVNFAAKPYLRAMETLTDINEYYGLDSARSIVQYFLANATGWRGDDAKRIKEELRNMLK